MTTYPFASSLDWPEIPGINRLPESRGNVLIGNDVWIGSGATILSGVTVGDGAVIGAHAVVSRDVPPYAVIVGNPGKVARLRFSRHIIEDLLKIRWWNWPRARIEQMLPFMLSNDIGRFLELAQCEWQDPLGAVAHARLSAS